MGGSVVSLPTRERGLKQENGGAFSDPRRSLPTRERGLKLQTRTFWLRWKKSLPTRERGLKPLYHYPFKIWRWSLPTRERGLKHFQKRPLKNRYFVAPYAGAWIETPNGLVCTVVISGRSLRGSVD